MAALGPATLKLENVNGMKDEDGNISHRPAGRWIGTLHSCIDTFTSWFVRGLRERSRDQGMDWGARDLGTLQPCLISHSVDVASLAVDLFIKLGSALYISGSGDVGYRWLILEGGITRGGSLYGCRLHHPDLRRSVGTQWIFCLVAPATIINTTSRPWPNKVAFLASLKTSSQRFPRLSCRDAVLHGLIEFQ